MQEDTYTKQISSQPATDSAKLQANNTPNGPNTNSI